MNPRQLLAELFQAAVAAAGPHRIAERLPLPPKGRTIVVGAGKASAVMAAAFERAWKGAGHAIDDGLVVTRHGSGLLDFQAIRIVEAAHPVPDAASFRYAREMLRLVSSAGADDLVVALMSGGGSSLLSLPPDAVGEEAKRELNKMLLACGATIHEMNVVRRHVSQIKGGRLAAAAHPARVVTYVMSDIPGDEIALVASGPTLASTSTPADALAIINRYRLDFPATVLSHLSSKDAAAPMADASFHSDETVVLATARQSLDRASDVAAASGLSAVILSDRIEGEAREIGRMHGALVRETVERDLFKQPCVLLSGGETTVTLRHPGGRGGRNTEFLLGLAEAIDGLAGVHALAADTDGIDGSEDNAGAFCDGGTAGKLRLRGTPIASFMASNDAYAAFQALGDLFVTGPTGTNVNDFRAVIIAARRPA